jgi:hypothetical protein
VEASLLTEAKASVNSMRLSASHWFCETRAISKWEKLLINGSQLQNRLRPSFFEAYSGSLAFRLRCRHVGFRCADVHIFEHWAD